MRNFAVLPCASKATEQQKASSTTGAQNCRMNGQTSDSQTDQAETSRMKGQGNKSVAPKCVTEHAACGKVKRGKWRRQREGGGSKQKEE